MPIEKWIAIKEKYDEIDKALEDYTKPYEDAPGADALRVSYFNQWLLQQGWSADEAAFIMESIKYWSSYPAKATKKSEAYAAANPLA